MVETYAETQLRAHVDRGGPVVVDGERACEVCDNNADSTEMRAHLG